MPILVHGKLPRACRILELPAFEDERGLLVATQSDLPFDLHRVFWICNVPQGAVRGQHAHRTCNELFVALSGSVEIYLSDGHSNCTLRLDSPTEALLIPAMVWCELRNFSPAFAGICLASSDFDAEGYIHDYAAFQEEVAPSRV